MEDIFINTKEDIIIPFKHIGDVLWKENTCRIINALNYNWNKEKAIPLTIQEIDELEERLNTKLPNTLKLFYLTFGIADIGEQLVSINDITYLKEIWEPHPQYGPQFTKDDLTVLPFLITFSDYIGNGNMFCFHKETQDIYYFDHDTQPYITKFFSDFEDYLRGCLILAQVDLFGEAEQKQVDQWTESIVIDLVGKDVVQKWRY